MTSPSEVWNQCAMCEAPLPEGRAVTCSDDCEERMNRDMDYWRNYLRMVECLKRDGEDQRAAFPDSVAGLVDATLPRHLKP